MPVCASASPLSTTVRRPSMKSSGSSGTCGGCQRIGFGGAATPSFAPVFQPACGSAW